MARGPQFTVLLLLELIAAILAVAADGRPQQQTRFLTPAEIVAQHPAAAPPPLTAAQRAKHAAAHARTLELLLGSVDKKKGGSGGGGTSACEAPKYRNRVLGSLHEANFLGLFKDLHNETKLEASGMDVVGDDLWVVFDNTPLVGLVDLHFGYEDDHNHLIPPARAALQGSGVRGAGGLGPRGGRRLRPAVRSRRNAQTDSQFEGISAIPSRPGEFIIVEEMREVSSKSSDDPDERESTFHPFAQRVAAARGRDGKPSGGAYRVLERCAMHMQLTHENKGVEGIEYIEDIRGKGYLMAACEGNWCSGGAKGREAGNGKIVVLEYQPGNSTEPCGWHVLKTLDIPSGAAFEDYSDLAFADPGVVSTAGPAGEKNNLGAIAVLSQESSALWIGRFDYDAMDFDPDVAGAAFLLPRNRRCDMVYCNAEGLAWLDGLRLAIASDRAKSNQPFWCTEKDETVGVFALPDGAEKMIGGWDEEEATEEGRDDEAEVAAAAGRAVDEEVVATVAAV